MEKDRRRGGEGAEEEEEEGQQVRGGLACGGGGGAGTEAGQLFAERWAVGSGGRRADASSSRMGGGEGDDVGMSVCLSERSPAQPNAARPMKASQPTPPLPPTPLPR